MYRLMGGRVGGESSEEVFPASLLCDVLVGVFFLVARVRSRDR